jgi:ankyrin repeat protein
VTDEELFAAARAGDVPALAVALDAEPASLGIRELPYGWSLLHAAAHQGQLAVVDLLLARGLDANTKEAGDNTTAMHWAAARGSASVVQRLADAGCDVVGHGDDHALEVIGWATCWDGCDDEAHREVVRILLERGARHHIFSAIATNDEAEVRRIVATNRDAIRQTLSRNEHFEQPLQFAVRKNLPAMVALLLELGADPSSPDSAGLTAVGYASWQRVDEGIIRLLAQHGAVTPFTSLVLRDYSAAERVMRVDPTFAEREGTLHLLAKRGEIDGARWLLDRGANVNAIWNHWDAHVTPLHMAIMENQPAVVRLLLERGADVTIKDTLYDSDAIGWAEYLGRPEILDMLRSRGGQ